MHRATSTAVLSAVAIAAAFGLSGCSQRIDPPPHSVVTLTPQPPPPEAAPPVPLPPPETLIDVMVRLTDPGVPGKDKLGLVQLSTPEDAAAMDRFDKAVSDGGFRPLTFEAHDLAPGQSPSAVQANFVIKTANPRVGEGGDFNFPMEFVFTPEGTWQLTRDSADMLLEFGGTEPTPSAEPPPPGPAPTP